MTRNISDEWQTPQWLFDELNKEFNLYVDLCATRNNYKCNMWTNDYLNCDLKNWYCSLQDFGSCFMNPPYSNPKPFIEKAWEDSKYCKIVCLVKCDPSTRWWATFWNYKEFWFEGTIYDRQGPKPGCEVRFFPKRIKFEHPEFSGKSGPTFPCALVIMDRRHEKDS